MGLGPTSGCTDAAHPLCSVPSSTLAWVEVGVVSARCVTAAQVHYHAASRATQLKRGPLAREMIRKYSAVFFLTLLLGCTHFRASRPGLSTTLRLLHPPVRKVTAGQKVEIASSLQNVGNAAVEVCLRESVVSAWLEGTQGSLMWPIILGGTVSDAECAERKLLQPGEQMDFVSRGGVSRELRPGPATLRLAIGVSSPLRNRTVQIRAEESIQLLAR
jgi:hypothetical protein